MASGLKNRIHRPNIILCEGTDAKNFLIWYLDWLIKHNNVIYDQFDVHDFGGITELGDFMQAFCLQSDFRAQVRSLCVIRDAETSAPRACASVQKSYIDNKFGIPVQPGHVFINAGYWAGIKTGYLLFPKLDNKPEDGCLEDLCLAILAKPDAPRLICKARDFMRSVAEDEDMSVMERFPHRHKNLLALYLSLTDKYVYFKLGEATRAGAFNLGAIQLTPLKDFLFQLAM